MKSDYGCIECFVTNVRKSMNCPYKKISTDMKIQTHTYTTTVILLHNKQHSLDLYNRPKFSKVVLTGQY